jgi:hypothetical protein
MAWGCPNGVQTVTFKFIITANPHILVAIAEADILQLVEAIFIRLSRVPFSLHPPI